MKRQNLFVLVLIGALALMPFLAVSVPRFLAFGPGLIGLLAFVAWPFVFGARVPLQKTLLYWMAGLLALGGSSALWAIDPDGALSRALKTALILLPGVLLVSVVAALPAQLLKPRLWVLPAGMALSVALVCIEMAFDFPIFRLVRGIEDGVRVGQSNMNRSVVTMLACAMPLLAVAGLYKAPWLRIGFMALCFVMILLTRSQSSQLAFIITLVFFALFPAGRRWAWGALAAGLIVMILNAPFLAIWMFNHLAADVNAMPFFGAGGGFGGQRLEIWDFVSRYALQNPLYGFGMEAARAVPAFDTQRIYGESAAVLHPHNGVLQFWIEFGLIGAAFLCGFFSWLLHGFAALGRVRARVALVPFTVLLTVGAFGYGVWQGWWLGLIFLAAAYTMLAMKALDVDNPGHE